ncbi:MAG TPA: MFS transporter [Jatrophihabitantaceae bacterium]|jgi:MFS family permease|nr:MFS transporter [Jatrophihabitantaceae bacterium]
MINDRRRASGTIGAAVASPERVTFLSLFTSREFATLWLAGAQSQIGDQLARVALSVLVFDRTGSGLATAATYALTLLPAVVGGVVLTGLADRYPRRTLIVVCDGLRAVLFALMAIAALPLPVLCVLLVAAVLCGSPYNAAEPAIVADMYQGDAYTAAIGVRTATVQTAQLIGFAAGGLVVALTGAHTALAIDAATFAVSAVLLQIGLVYRPAVATVARHGLEQIRIGFRTVAGDRRLRLLLALAWLAAFWTIPEGLAAPYASAHGGGPTSVGILLAANPAGNLIGVVVLTRWVPTALRPRLLGLLAIASGLPLILCGLGPGIAVTTVLWGLSGLLSAYLVLIVTEFVAIVPPNVRGQAIGLASSGLLAAQGIGLLIGGGIASLWAVGPTIAVAGVAGSLVAVPLAVARRQSGTAPPG